MDVREKLTHILTSDPEMLKNLNVSTIRLYRLVDKLIANGVSVQERKPLEVFLHPIDAYKGLKAKYLVFKADTGEQVVNCFVLRPDKDAAAVEALRAYAHTTDNKTVANDIYNWVGKGVTVQEWISVKDRLPENEQNVLVADNGFIAVWTFYGDYWEDSHGWWQEFDEVTYWMPLPKPPKGE